MQRMVPSKGKLDKVIVGKIRKKFDHPYSILQIAIIASVGLMVSGFLDTLVQQNPSQLPGPSTISLSALLHLSRDALSLAAMSVGLLLLLFIPSLRVFLGFETFLRKKEITNMLVALIVLAELIMSIFL